METPGMYTVTGTQPGLQGYRHGFGIRPRGLVSGVFLAVSAPAPPTGQGR